MGDPYNQAPPGNDGARLVQPVINPQWYNGPQFGEYIGGFRICVGLLFVAQAWAWIASVYYVLIPYTPREATEIDNTLRILIPMIACTHVVMCILVHALVFNAIPASKAVFRPVWITQQLSIVDQLCILYTICGTVTAVLAGIFPFLSTWPWWVKWVPGGLVLLVIHLRQSDLICHWLSHHTMWFPCSTTTYFMDLLGMKTRRRLRQQHFH